MCWLLWLTHCAGHLFEPIPVEDFKEHVKSLHRNDDYPFSEEYSVNTINLYDTFEEKNEMMNLSFHAEC